MNFVGSYVDDIVDVLVASAVSGSHAILIGAPGWGKTAISRQAAQAMVGSDTYSFTRIDPSTPPERVLGAYNPAKLINDGVMERVTDGTPYDVGAKVSIMDELFRGRDELFDACLDVFDRQDVTLPPPVWATANFVATGERVEALVDRIGLWLWIKPDVLDVTAVSTAHLLNGGKPTLAHKLPTPKEIIAIRESVPGPNAVTAVNQALEALAGEATKEGRRPHPRRIANWAKILYAYSVWELGIVPDKPGEEVDFTTIPNSALKVLKYAYPATTEAEAAEWENIAGAATDPVATAIEEALKMAYPVFKEVSQMADAVTRAGEAPRLGTVSVQAQKMLEALNINDPRITEAVQRLNIWLGDAVRGKEVSLG